ncbi:MAG: hypothetical protein RIC07_16600 [Coleofasciculus sp. E1-EBD-02]
MQRLYSTMVPKVLINMSTAISRLVEINLTRLSYVNKHQTLTVPCSLFPVP